MHRQLASGWLLTVRARHAARCLACAALVTALAACGGGADEPSATQTPAPPASPTAIATDVPDLAIGEVVWTETLLTTGAPGDPVDTFSRETPVVHAVVRVQHVPAGSAFTAVWTLDGSELPKLNQKVTVEGASEDGWVAFTLTWNDEIRWPSGTLGITITGPGGVTSTGSVGVAS